ncbi:MAG TPA: dihydropteroate synthase [Xanthomonadaceae bacterium]|nr:dihydropteroate synthase [Xanthomonadaceae bacterium]
MFDTTPALDCAGRVLELDRPRIMGVVNVTPDSFSDGGHHADAEAAVAHALRLVEAGADLLDVGGESTRPGAGEVPVADEIARVIPVIEALAARSHVPVSVDTSKPEVMRAALAAGAGMVNDVFALRREGALEAVAGSGAAVVLVHMQGEPRTMQEAPAYDDVVMEVHRFLAQRIFACEMAGIDKRRIVVDPGFGFGKRLEDNLALLRNLSAFADLGRPVMAGLSRKSMIGTLTGRGVGERIHGSVAAAVIAAAHGATFVRVHDVAATRDALAVWRAVASQPDATPRRSQAPKTLWPDED